MINIIKHNWNWRFAPRKRTETKYFVLHHAAAETASPEQIHNWHLQRDGETWAGIGYNFYVRKNGEIHEGRPIDAAGGHTLNYNSTTLGICFEGNYDKEMVMPLAQLNAGKALLKYLHCIYPSASIKCHRDLNSTACPGKFFPLGEILKYNDNAESEIENMKRFKTINELPYGKDEISELVKCGALNGKANQITGEDLGLDLSEDMLRILIIVYRLFKLFVNHA